MSYDELLIVLENIIIDKVVTVPTARNRKIDTSAPMKIGMAAKGDCENVRAEGDQRIVPRIASRLQRTVEFWQGFELE